MCKVIYVFGLPLLPQLHKFPCTLLKASDLLADILSIKNWRTSLYRLGYFRSVASKFRMIYYDYDAEFIMWVCKFKWLFSTLYKSYCISIIYWSTKFFVQPGVVAQQSMCYTILWHVHDYASQAQHGQWFLHMSSLLDHERCQMDLIKKIWLY